MNTTLITNDDGSQYIIHTDGEVNNVTVHISGGVRPANEQVLDLTAAEAEQLAIKLQTHRVSFDTIGKDMKFTKKPARKFKQDTTK